MTPQEALRNLQQAAEAFRGTLQDHMMLQESAKTILAFIEKHGKKRVKSPVKKEEETT